MCDHYNPEAKLDDLKRKVALEEAVRFHIGIAAQRPATGEQVAATAAVFLGFLNPAPPEA